MSKKVLAGDSLPTYMDSRNQTAAAAAAAAAAAVVDRSSYAPDFQFPLRINVKISEHAQNFNVFKPRLVCRRILILP